MIFLKFHKFLTSFLTFQIWSDSSAAAAGRQAEVRSIQVEVFWATRCNQHELRYWAVGGLSSRIPSSLEGVPRLEVEEPQTHDNGREREGSALDYGKWFEFRLKWASMFTNVIIIFSCKDSSSYPAAKNRPKRFSPPIFPNSIHATQLKPQWQ